MHLSVRGLVEFLLRGGDIDNRIPAGADDAMQRGAQMHRRIQREAGPQYHAEVPLSFAYRFPDSDDEIVIDGRADGIFPGEGELATIDEIKSTFRPMRRIREPEKVHLSQAKCYAFIYANDEDLPEIGVRMTYVNLDTEEVKYFTETYSREEITIWFTALMEEYRKWAEYTAEARAKCAASIRQLSFPFPYREGQRELAEYVYRTIAHERKLFLNAPTGTGKTIATVFPALKAIGEEKADRIFYLTAKTLTRRVAEDTFSLLRERGALYCRGVTITARDKICVLEKANCNPDACPRAKGHYDRINDALYDMLMNEESMTRDVIARYADKHGVCPFEMSLDLSLFADAVICDYNYVFDPHVYLRRFFGEGGLQSKAVFLIDEAHNLIDRAREMYSAQLDRGEIASLRRRVKEVYPTLYKKLGTLNTKLLDIRKRLREETGTPVLVLDDIQPLADAAARAQETLSSIMEKERRKDRLNPGAREPAAGMRYSLEEEKKEMQESLLECFFALSHFLLIYEKTDAEHYVIYAQEQEKDLVLHLFNVDPSQNLAECMDRGVASVLFSATLLPIQYHKRLLGGTKEDYEVYAKSIFDPRCMGLFIARDVTSKYSRRNDSEYERIASAILSMVRQRYGNYLVFFPSYAFMRAALAALRRRMETDGGDGVRLMEQRSDMREEDRAAFLSCFEISQDEESLVGCCVLGGAFSEGIDLRGDRLIGVIIVGTGIPQVCTEREILKEHFAAAGDNGYDYAYRFPGMNKVLQAAGRVIRTEEDTGFVALLDERFLTGAYRSLFPREWQGYEAYYSADLGRRVSSFWDEWL